MKGTILAVCASARRGQKALVQGALLQAGHGMAADFHGGTWHRQISLLPAEQIQRITARGLQLPPGAFGENLITEGIDLQRLAVGQCLRVGRRAVLQITQLGKECHTPCEIFRAVGECIMPRFGVFCRVRRGGEVSAGDAVRSAPELDAPRYAVLTLSDRRSRGEGQDLAGPEASRLLEQLLGVPPVCAPVLPDHRPAIEQELIRLCDEELCDLVVTTGGTGLSPRDVTPEATLAVIQRQVPGMAEAMRAVGLAHTPHAMLSRAVCGQRGQALIVNLSGSPRAVRQQLAALLPALPHALQTASGRPLSCGEEAPHGRGPAPASGAGGPAPHPPPAEG